MNILEIIFSIYCRPILKRLDHWLQLQCSRQRYEHILRVVNTAVTLAPKFGVSATRARVAAMAHDMVREWPGERLMEMARSSGYIPTHMEQEKPVLLHGRCAAILLRKNFAVRNQSILAALTDHTLGRWGMDELGILLFASDYLEPGRRYITEEFRNRALQLPPWEMVIAVNEHAKARGKKKSPQTRQLHDYAKRKAGLPLPGRTADLRSSVKQPTSALRRNIRIEARE